jgi:hypothetical protein
MNQHVVKSNFKRIAVYLITATMALMNFASCTNRNEDEPYDDEIINCRLYVYSEMDFRVDTTFCYGFATIERIDKASSWGREEDFVINGYITDAVVKFDSTVFVYNSADGHNRYEPENFRNPAEGESIHLIYDVEGKEPYDETVYIKQVDILEVPVDEVLVGRDVVSIRFRSYYIHQEINFEALFYNENGEYLISASVLTSGNDTIANLTLPIVNNAVKVKLQMRYSRSDKHGNNSNGIDQWSRFKSERIKFGYYDYLPEDQ